MADVGEDRRQRGESHEQAGEARGQLILVTGLAVAVTLVALVLLLNTVIYTQNLATRGAEVEDGEALSFRREVARGVGGVVDAENHAEYDSRTKVEENVTEGVVRYDALLSRYHAGRGTVADVEEGTLSFTDGVLLRQTNASRDFSAAGNDAPVDWTLAGNTQRVRAFRTTVSGENLTDATDASPAGFTVRVVGDSGDVWRVLLYNDSAEEIAVAVQNGSEASPHAVCSASGPEATVDLTAGTINGTACPGLVWATGVAAPYDVQFRNGTEAAGTYALTVDTSSPDADAKTANFAGPDAGESPRAIPAVYAAEFEIHYETPTLAFHTAVRVAPGEPE